VDLREIQALHTQYASQPVTIDLAGQVAALPALPGLAGQPELMPPQSRRAAALLRTAAKPVAIGIAAGAVAIGAALSGLQLYRAMHHVPAPAVVAAAAPARVPEKHEMPVNAEPAHPLTDQDLDRHDGSRGSGLSSVDLHTIVGSPTHPVAAGVGTEQPASLQESAAASPIHASHGSLAPATAPAASVTIAAPAQPAPPGQPPLSETAGSKSGPAAPIVASVPAPVARPAARPAHHPVHRGVAAVATQAASGEPAASHAELTTRPVPAAKSADVQLF